MARNTTSERDPGACGGSWALERRLLELSSAIHGRMPVMVRHRGFRFRVGRKAVKGEYLGAEPTLPYLSPDLRGEKLLIGANFASAGIGILNDTGIQFLSIIRITRQLEFFQQHQQRLSSMVGPDQTQQIVNNALVLIVLGGNDFVNNYYLVPYSARSREYSLPDFVTYLISEYKKILARLYELGARRVIVTGTGPLGCVPSELARSQNGECNPDLLQAGDLFNPQLVTILNELNTQYGSDVFVAANAFKMHSDFLSNPQAFDKELLARHAL
ncbi:hypothetical protein J5N97_024289 [Dioscorea zingiberensis]|uniref:GDSL esterase/lipase n=1 Tax=Dioscorea zingiberensis TaxID=325984 RepID=A0A9D5C676_9LILI|nr:hypothetical protein J5N97_024289 [Dioscorea zingiberensis]